MASQVYLAADFGASSGRLVAGSFDGKSLQLKEIHRFENGPVAMAGHLHWDLPRLWSELLAGLQKASAELPAASIASVGVDTWGVDFALLGRNQTLLGNPFHYRDPQTDGILERAFRIVPRQDIFAATGLQFMQFNTLYQLLAMREQDSPLLDMAERFLMMPDVFHWLLTGNLTNELTNATTTQFLNPVSGDWARELLNRFQLPSSMFPDLVPPGAELGSLRAQVRSITGLSQLKVVAPGTHDTASAVMAVPAAAPPTGQDPNWCYISSGTWALMGVENPHPVINDLCAKLNFTNEGGVGGTIRLLKNITGLWLLQECRRSWNASGRELDWEQMNRLADASPSLASLINPDDPRFMAPTHMPEAIRAACQQQNEPVPHDEAAVIRCALDSLAMKSRQVLSWLERLVGRRLNTIHIVGGGALNARLCQATADACGRTVIAGPVEATAIGNIMVQAVAAGACASIAEAREIVRHSFPAQTYQPHNPAAWDAAWPRFQQISPEP